MSSSRRAEAETLVVRAVSAREANKLDLSLELYRQSLEIWIELYKAETRAEAKAELQLILQQNMAEAEKIKELLSRQTAPPPALTKARSNGAKTSNNNTKSSLPDFHDYTTQRRLKKASATNTSSSICSVRKAPVLPLVKPKKEPPVEAAETSGKTHKLDEYMTQIMDEIVDKSPSVRWDDIAGLPFAKQTLQEAVILPNLRPDLFTGLRSPPRGVLLFGPPGTGKTMLAKAVATESGFTFFSISASSVMSKYLGEGEKLMRALFEIARQKQPCVIFFDEIDALMSSRKENEHEASRRLKTEFMTQIDGATSSSEDRILIMGATNMPWDLDEAVLRRLPKRIYVPLPDEESRKALTAQLLRKQGSFNISPRDLDRIVLLTNGYSGSDLSAVCHEAALGPLREVDPAKLRTIKAEEVRAIGLQDFERAVQVIRPSVSGASLQQFQRWVEQYGVTR